MQSQQQMQGTCNIEARSRNHCCHGKAISITYSECVFIAVVIQHAKRMRLILSSVTFLSPPHASTLFHKRHYLRKTVINNMCILTFSKLYIRDISHFKNNSARY